MRTIEAIFRGGRNAPDIRRVTALRALPALRFLTLKILQLVLHALPVIGVRRSVYFFCDHRP